MSFVRFKLRVTHEPLGDELVWVLEVIGVSLTRKDGDPNGCLQYGRSLVHCPN